MDENFEKMLNDRIEKNVRLIELVQYKLPYVIMRRATKKAVEEALQTTNEFTDVDKKFMVAMSGLLGECKYLGMDSTEALEVFVRLQWHDPNNYRLGKEELNAMMVCKVLQSQRTRTESELVENVYDIITRCKDEIEKKGNEIHYNIVNKINQKAGVIVVNMQSL